MPSPSPSPSPSPRPSAPSAPDVPLLRVDGLRFAHADAPPLFDGLSFALPAGLTRLEAEVGKTTLLRLLAGALPWPAGARAWLQGAPWTPSAESPAVFWLDPRDGDWEACTPGAVAARVADRYPRFDAQAWARHLAAFGLADQGHKTMHMLSTGSRRKVALSAALAAQAPLTLLDEPVGGLDQPSTAWLVEALTDAAREPGRAWLLAAAWGLESRLPWAGVLDLDAGATAAG